MRMRRLAASVLLTMTAASTATAASPWTLARGDLALTPTFLYETFDRFFLGTDETRGPERGVHQTTFSTTLEYGILDELTADLTLGFTRSVVETAAGDDGEDGLADTTFGLRYRLVDEFTSDSPWMPTLGVRVGGIVEGTYQQGLVQSPGDGASGVQADLLFGKSFGASGFGMSGSVGYRHRTELVPDDLLLSLGVYQTFLQYGLASVGFRHEQGLSGSDIGDQGFNFPGLKEIATSLESSLSLRHPDGHSLGFVFAHTFDGRNTGKKLVYGGVLTLVFPTGG